MLDIDGSIGEGSGQIVRTSLALSLCLGKPFTIKNIRIKRRKPGLAWQHLAAVKAAAEIGKAEVHGAEHKSTEFYFVPHNILGGNYTFDIGTAGSTSLVIQTVLPALIHANQSSTITLIGGTHNPLSPSFDFLLKSYFPILRLMGISLKADLLNPGYAPKGGGVVKIKIDPCKKLIPLQLEERGKTMEINITARVAGLPLHIAQREINTLRELLPDDNIHTSIEEQPAQYGPGNVLFAEVISENITEVFTGYGQPHLPAEKVASQLAKEVQHYLNNNVPVGHHLADQLLLPMALCGSGYINTLTPTSHTLTNIQIIQQFLAITFNCQKLTNDIYKISLK